MFKEDTLKSEGPLLPTLQRKPKIPELGDTWRGTEVSSKASLCHWGGAEGQTAQNNTLPAAWMLFRKYEFLFCSSALIAGETWRADACLIYERAGKEVVKFVYESVGCPCLPLEGFTQILVRYLHGFFAHLFCLQAEAGRDRLKRKGSQECFAKVLPVVFPLPPGISSCRGWCWRGSQSSW